ncbi:MAG: restriction endonuclease [Rubrobacteraceae bacterium]|nr:restriction endonuclease [Rubrobacteraceae bacterium]
MKLTEIQDLVNAGTFTDSDAWSRVEADLRASIAGVVWPPGNDRFVINPVIDGNGVVPIKRQFSSNISALGWKLEERFPRFSDEEVVKRRRPGAVDAALDLSAYGLPPFFVEWETGNIASSHRAMNKMALALKRGLISGGIWVVSSGDLAPYLTDRIGNYPEFEPYFDLYSDLEVEAGYLGVAIVEHDETSLEAPFIDKQQTRRWRSLTGIASPLAPC